MKSNDLNEVEKIAHILKGAALYISAAAIKKLAFKIEIACRKGGKDGAGILLEQSNNIFHNTEPINS